MLRALPGHWKTARDHWLQERFPDSKETTLGLNRIFVLPTPTSLAMLVTTLLLFMMAINFQNALVYALSFWLLSLLIINIFFTYRNLAGLTIRSISTSPCFADEKAVFEIEISNPSKRKISGITVGWKHQDATEITLGPWQSSRIRLSHSVQKRGKYKPQKLDIFTRYPTGLIIAWSYAALDMESIVYPAPELRESAEDGQSRDDLAIDGKEIARGSTDFSGIRSYEAGDSPKHIHWGTYAKTGQLHTKSFVDYASHDLWLDWDNLSIQGIENKLSHLCARVLECNQQQLSYGLKIPGTTISPAQGEAHKTACLTALALYGENS